MLTLKEYKAKQESYIDSRVQSKIDDEITRIKNHNPSNEKRITLEGFYHWMQHTIKSVNYISDEEFENIQEKFK